MPAGLPVALALLAQAAAAAAGDPPAAPPPSARAAYGPPVPAVRVPVKPPEPVKAADASCEAAEAKANGNEIVVCAQRPQGYRLDPDVLEAQREMRAIRHGRPNRPLGTARDNPCATVGPMGCRGGAMINIVQAAITAATMAQRLGRGEEIGSMFITDPQPDEYQLYREAKQRREAREAAIKAKAVAEAAARTKAAAAAAATTAAPPVPQPDAAQPAPAPAR